MPGQDNRAWRIDSWSTSWSAHSRSTILTSRKTHAEPGPAGPVPDGIYLRDRPDSSDPVPPDGATATEPVGRWRFTGRNPDFWWDLVISRRDSGDQRYELHCTNCGHTDQAFVMDDVLRLIRAGAHFHDIDPAGGV